MCLITKQSKPTILTEDMVVYKSLYIKTTYFLNLKFKFLQKQKILSIYYKNIWKLHCLYKTNITETYSSDELRFYDICAYDTYINNICTINQLPQLIYNGTLHSYSTGFHTADTAERAKEIGYSVFKCIIPAGSEIYKDDSGLIVSNQLILVENIS